jgi:hypothetical protein
MTVQEVRLDRGGTELAGDYVFFWMGIYIRDSYQQLEK